MSRPHPSETTSRAKHSAGWVRAVASVAAIAGALVGCTSSSVAANASARLTGLRRMDVLVQPPAGGTLVGSAEDHGDNSSVIGRNPGITSVFASAVFPRALEAYYQSVYSKYHLSEDCCANATQVQLTGASPNATVGIDITTGAPHIPDHFHIQQRAAPPGATTFATVQITATH